MPRTREAQQVGGPNEQRKKKMLYVLYTRKRAANLGNKAREKKMVKTTSKTIFEI